MSIRGIFTITSRTFAVADNNFCEMQQNGTFTIWGNVANDSLPVTMTASPQQLLLASAGNAYVFDLAANTITQIPGVTFSGPVAQVGICNSFFIVTIKNSKEFVVSAPLDANDWATIGAAIVDVFPDNIVSFIVSHLELWFFSDTKTAVYAPNPSEPLFPFTFIPGSDMDQGCVAEFSTALLGNTVFWLGSDERGQGVVWRASGYTPQRVSNHAIELAIQSYTRIDDAIALTMQDQGHYFYILYFPTPSVTWCYDLVTNMWHQRGFWVTLSGTYQAAHYQNHTFNWGKHLGGDWSSNKVYEIHIPYEIAGVWYFASDNGNPIVRLRRSPHMSQEQEREFYHELQVFVEPGLGPSPALVGPQAPTYLFLLDSLDVGWRTGVTDIGVLQVNPGTGATQTLVLNDPGNTTSWNVLVSTIGVLFTTVAVFNAANPQTFDFVSTSGLELWSMQVTNIGVLQTVFEGDYLPARDPEMNLRWSSDAAKTWSNYYVRGCGRAGEYKKRVMWRRLGQSRDRVWEISCNDPIAWRIIDGYVKFTTREGG